MKGIEKRTNKRTGRTEYRKRYRYKDTAGKTHGSKTPWLQSQAEVLSYIQDTQKEKAGGLLTDDPTLEALIMDYMHWLMSDNNDITPGTIRTYYTLSGLIIKNTPRQILNTRLHRIGEDTAINLTRYYSELELHGHISHNTFINYKKTIKHIFQHIENTTTWTAYNPTIATKCLRDIDQIGRIAYKHTVKKQSSVYWTWNEFQAVLDTINWTPNTYMQPTGKCPENTEAYKRHMEWMHDLKPTVKAGKKTEAEKYAVIACMYYTGTRFEELRALQWDAVDFDDMTISITTAKAYNIAGSRAKLERYAKEEGTTKNTASQRTIPMLPPLYNALFSWYEYNDQPAEGLVFTPLRASRDGMLAPTSLIYWLTTASQKAGIKYIHPHALRHSATMYFVNELRLSEDDTAAILGHTDRTMLDAVYLHQKQEIRARQAFNAVKSYIPK